MIVPEGTQWGWVRGRTARQNPFGSQYLKTEKLIPYYFDPGLTDSVQHPLIKLGQDLIDYDGSVQHLDL